MNLLLIKQGIFYLYRSYFFVATNTKMHPMHSHRFQVFNCTPDAIRTTYDNETKMNTFAHCLFIDGY
jgi:hypothetical protein